MRRLHRAGALFVVCLLVAPSTFGAENDSATNPIVIDEWEVPYGGHPRDPYAAGDTIWFVGQHGHYIGGFKPATETFFKRDLPDEAGPHNLIARSGGGVWFSGNLKGYIGRFDPDSDEITRIEMPDPAARDPHTLVFDESEQHIWFTVQWGNFVGRLTLADSSIELIAIPTDDARPYGIKMAPDGTPWIALLGTNKLASVDPDTLELTEHVIPADAARPRRLEVTGDGRVWYSDYARGYLGLYDPGKNTYDEWVLPSGDNSLPYGTAKDKHGRIWLVETGVSPNLFVGFDTVSETIVSVTPIPSGGGSVRHMDYAPGSNSIWFGTDKGTMARAKISD